MAFACGLVASLGVSVASAQGTDASSWESNLSRETKELAGGETLRYRLYKPSEPRSGERYPLVLFLHGAGERGDDNAAQLKHGVREFMERQDQNPCYLLVPQCPTGKRWVEADWSEESGKGTFPEDPSVTMRGVLDVIDALVASEPIDPQRMYVTGLSMGGYGTWYASGFKGTPFVAAAPVCGGGDPQWASRYVGMPLWAFHGDADRAVPVKRSREMIAAIKEAGGEAKYTEYPGVGHDSWTQTYADDAFHAWLFSQRKAK